MAGREPVKDELYLDEAAVRFIEARLSSIRAIEAELNGALALLIEMNGLQGRWQLDMPNKRLVPAEAQLKAA